MPKRRLLVRPSKYNCKRSAKQPCTSEDSGYHNGRSLDVLVSGPTAANGYVDATGILAQVDYLQRQYAPWGIQFQVKPISYALNAEWAAAIDNDKDEKMRQLHRGDYKSLNVYLVEGATSGVCSLPIEGTDPLNQTQLDGDGCFVPLSSGISSTDGTVAHESTYQYSFS